MKDSNNTKKNNTFSKTDTLALEILSKACPRCGGKSANSSNSAGRCRSCLDKLARAKKTPGHWQRAQTKADDALRRQKGKAGGHPTAKGTSRGNGTRKEIVSKIKNAENKTGQKLSPDRKDNGKGYESSNVRAVPENLNRGRHDVDEKKLKAWKKRLKKAEDLNKINIKGIAATGAAAVAGLMTPNMQLGSSPKQMPNVVSPEKPGVNIKNTKSANAIARIKPGEVIISHKDPRIRVEEREMESKMGLPNGILSGIRLGGEKSNADEVSEAGARGIYQFIPNTRRLFLNKYGVDAWADTLAAIKAAALHIKESLEWASSDLGVSNKKNRNVIIHAMRHYHAGSNKAGWGPRTEKYGPRAYKVMREISNQEKSKKAVIEDNK